MSMMTMNNPHGFTKTTRDSTITKKLKSLKWTDDKIKSYLKGWRMAGLILSNKN